MQVVAKNELFKMASLIACTVPFLSQFFFSKKHNDKLRFQDETEPFIRHATLHASDLKGKDLLIVGDVHGCCDELKAIIELAKTKTEKKLLTVLVGDIINKGPQNVEALDLVMNSKDTFSVRGNHDQKILKLFYDKKKKTEEIEVRAWMEHFTAKHADFVKSLPYTLSIPSVNIVVVHGGLIPGVPLMEQGVNNMLHMRSLKYEKNYFGDTVLEASSQKIPGYLWGKHWQGPQHIYFGHDAVEGLQLHPHCTGLDTGCVYGGKLTGALLYLPNSKTEQIHREILHITPLKTYKDVGYKHSD